MEKESLDFTTIDYDKIQQYAKRMNSIFQDNENIEKNAYLNWRMQFSTTKRTQFIIIGEAYLSSAYNLLQQCIENNKDKKADLWIFPILFNIVHGIEVYLKAINMVLSIVLDEARKIKDGKHDIRGLCATAKNLIRKYKEKQNSPTAEQMLTAIIVVENFINNIYEKTDDMTFARYPMDKKENGQFYIQTFENEVINLDLLEEQMRYVYKMLNFIYEMPEVYMENNFDTIFDYY